MPKLQDVISELHFLSDRLSTQVRVLAIGLLVLSWGLLIGESQTAKEAAEAMKRGLLFVGFLSVLTMFCDFLQYVLGYIDTDKVRRKAEDSDQKQARYNERCWTYVWRLRLFWGKQILLAVTVVFFLLMLGRYLVRL